MATKTVETQGMPVDSQAGQDVQQVTPRSRRVANTLQTIANLVRRAGTLIDGIPGNYGAEDEKQFRDWAKIGTFGRKVEARNQTKPVWKCVYGSKVAPVDKPDVLNAILASKAVAYRQDFTLILQGLAAVNALTDAMSNADLHAEFAKQASVEVAEFNPGQMIKKVTRDIEVFNRAIDADNLRREISRELDSAAKRYGEEQ